MTIAEALADIDMRGRGDESNQLASQEEIACPDTQPAVRLLAEAYEHLRKRDHLYADRRRCASLAPPPASLPPS